MTIDNPALQSLANAYQQCIGRMEGIERRPDALKFLIEMRQTLPGADGFCREIRRVLAIGDPGPTMTAELTRLEGESAAIAAEIAQVETSVAELEKTAQAHDAELKKLQAAKQREAELRQELSELERLDEVAADETRLRALVTELEARISLTDTKQLLARLSEVAPVVLQRSEAHEQALGEQLEQVLAALQASDLRLKQLNAELQKAHAHWGEEREVLSDVRNALETYARADQAIAEAVPGAANVQAALNQVSRQLEDIDRALHTAIEANQSRIVQRLKAIGFTGAPIDPAPSGNEELPHGAL